MALSEEDRQQMDTLTMLMKRCRETNLTLEFLQTLLDDHIKTMRPVVLAVLGGADKIKEEIYRDGRI